MKQGRVIDVDQEEGLAMLRKWGAFALVVGFTLLQAYGIMLALGVLSNDVSPVVPALGYWATWSLLWALRALVSAFRRKGASS